MNRSTAILTVVLCAFLTATFGGLLAASDAHASTGCPAVVEDDGNWNWAKCGNHQRGVTDLIGRDRVVGVCQFNRLWSAGAIRYGSGLKRLRGDKFARSLTDCPWRIKQNRPFPEHAEGIF